MPHDKSRKGNGLQNDKTGQTHFIISRPRYFRAIAYFCIRYFLKLGFLDGVAGWRWHFGQGLWYRWIVDREIGELRR